MKGDFECLPVTFKGEGPEWKTTSSTCFGALFIYFKWISHCYSFFFFSSLFLTMARGVWNLIPLVRGQTCVPYSGKSPNLWMIRDVPIWGFVSG